MRVFSMARCSGMRRGKRSSRDNRMKMMLFISWLLLLSPMIVAAQVDHSHSPAPAEDCAKLSPDMQSVIAAMDGPGSRIDALARPERIPAIEPGLHKLEVVLRPLSEVRLVERDSLCRQTPGPECAMAEKTKPKENVKNLFGGFVRLTVPKDGTYQISADS